MVIDEIRVELSFELVQGVVGGREHGFLSHLQHKPVQHARVDQGEKLKQSTHRRQSTHKSLTESVSRTHTIRI